MKILLLPGLDGSGELFRPLVDALPEDIQPIIISCPADQEPGDKELVIYTGAPLPNEKFAIWGSFSGYIACHIA